METSTTPPAKGGYELATLLVAVLVCMFLFFIDEGYYNFNYLHQPGNLLLLVIYITGFWSGQLIMAEFFLKDRPGLKKILPAALVGLPLGFALTMLFLGMIKLLFSLNL